MTAHITSDPEFDNIARNAAIACEANGAKLTPLRREILQLVWESQKPIGAYAVMDVYRQRSDRAQVAPPTVYRALDFLQEHGLVHKIHSQNTYVMCCAPNHSHGNVIFSCKSCGDAAEINSPAIAKSLSQSSNEIGFTPANQIVEISGLCKSCQT